MIWTNVMPSTVVYRRLIFIPLFIWMLWSQTIIIVVKLKYFRNRAYSRVEWQYSVFSPPGCALVRGFGSCWRWPQWLDVLHSTQLSDDHRQMVLQLLGVHEWPLAGPECCSIIQNRGLVGAYMDSRFSLSLGAATDPLGFSVLVFRVLNIICLEHMFRFFLFIKTYNSKDF